MMKLLVMAGTLAFSLVAGASTPVEQLYPTCAACHGVRAEGNEVMGGPRLSGQNAWYLAEQLRNFKSGARGWNPQDSPGQSMAAIAKTLDEVAIVALSEYLEGLGGETSSVVVDESSHGYRLYSDNCMICHGRDAGGVAPLFIPNLHILSDWYLRRQLESYSNNWRGDPVHGTTRAKGMRAIAAQLSSPAEIEQIVKFLTSGSAP